MLGLETRGYILRGGLGRFLLRRTVDTSNPPSIDTSNPAFTGAADWD